MSTPSNPIVRAVTAAATVGLSETPALFKAAGAAIQGKNPISAYVTGGGPFDGPKMPSPSTPAVTAVTPATNPAVLAPSPAASLRKRRLFSTLVTNPYGLAADPSVVQKPGTLLGSNAFNPTLGR